MGVTQIRKEGDGKAWIKKRQKERRGEDKGKGGGEGKGGGKGRKVGVDKGQSGGMISPESHKAWRYEVKTAYCSCGDHRKILPYYSHIHTHTKACAHPVKLQLRHLGCLLALPLQYLCHHPHLSELDIYSLAQTGDPLGCN